MPFENNVQLLCMPMQFPALTTVLALMVCKMLTGCGHPFPTVQQKTIPCDYVPDDFQIPGSMIRPWDEPTQHYEPDRFSCDYSHDSSNPCPACICRMGDIADHFDEMALYDWNLKWAERNGAHCSNFEEFQQYEQRAREENQQMLATAHTHDEQMQQEWAEDCEWQHHVLQQLYGSPQQDPALDFTDEDIAEMS